MKNLDKNQDLPRTKIQNILIILFFTLFFILLFIFLFPNVATYIVNPNATGWEGLGTGLFLIYGVIPATILLLIILAIIIVIVGIRERRKKRHLS